jgi:hypothetical protein
MFISKEERQDLWKNIHRLERLVTDLLLEKEQAALAKSLKPKRTISPEGRANISAGRRAAFARRKAEREAAQ